MIQVRGYAASGPKSALAPWEFQRPDLGPREILVDILYCGICHSDIHTARDEWGGTVYPVVPGHEIVGKVARIGPKVKRFRPGDVAGVGCFVDSCRQCESCREGLEQYCEGLISFTYNSTLQDGKTRTYGGYSQQIAVDEDYALRIPPGLPLEQVAPLLCAGITTHSPLREFKVGRGHRLGVLGLGGLGHMAVKIGSAMGAEVTVLSSSKSKQADAKRLGAHDFRHTADGDRLKSLAGHFDFIIDTVAAPHPLNDYLDLLRRDGRMILVGAPPQAVPVEPFSLIARRRRLVGSLIGGIRQTQEMLEFCAEKKALADVEVIPIQKVNEAYDRAVKGDVRFRFVIDLKTL